MCSICASAEHAGHRVVALSDFIQMLSDAVSGRHREASSATSPERLKKIKSDVMSKIANIKDLVITQLNRLSTLVNEFTTYEVQLGGVLNDR